LLLLRPLDICKNILINENFYYNHLCALYKQFRFFTNPSVKDRMNIEIAYCHYPWLDDYDYGTTGDKAKTFTPACIIETNYALFNFLEAGAYLGYSMYERLYIEGTYKS
jgi:hypothetical protein